MSRGDVVGGPNAVQGVAEGKRFWDGAVARWHEEFQAAISLEKNFLKVAYEVIEVKEYGALLLKHGCAVLMMPEQRCRGSVR